MRRSPVMIKLAGSPSHCRMHLSVGTLLLVLVDFQIMRAINPKDNRPSADPFIATAARVGHIAL